MKRILAALSVFLFANLASAEEIRTAFWACAGWDDGKDDGNQIPEPFMLKYSEGLMQTSEDVIIHNKKTYKIRDEDLKDFLLGNHIILLADSIRKFNEDGSLMIWKDQALLVKQRDKKLELTAIDGMSSYLFETEERTYCNLIE